MSRLRASRPAALLLWLAAATALVGGGAWPQPEATMVSLGALEAAESPHALHLDPGNPTPMRLVVRDIMPGDEHARRHRIVPPHRAAVDVSVRTVAVHDVENGCSEDEAAEDTSCGRKGEGELSARLQLTVQAHAVRPGEPCALARPRQRLATGGLTALHDDRHQHDAVRVQAPAELCVEVRVGLPFDTPNDTQGDAAHFTVLWRADAVPGGVRGGGAGG